MKIDPKRESVPLKDSDPLVCSEPTDSRDPMEKSEPKDRRDPNGHRAPSIISDPECESAPLEAIDPNHLSAPVYSSDPKVPSAFVSARELAAMGFKLPEDTPETAVAFRHRLSPLRRVVDGGVETFVVDLWAGPSGKRLELELPISRPNKPVCRPLRRVAR